MSCLDEPSALVVPLTGHVDRNWINLIFGMFGMAKSCPSRGTWIETIISQIKNFPAPVVPLTGHVDRNCQPFFFAQAGSLSCPSRGTWIEMSMTRSSRPSSGGSCPSRGTWIEISRRSIRGRTKRVVPLTGHVDRNVVVGVTEEAVAVVPLTGHVDRNNKYHPAAVYCDRRSCPSRGTWIEMPLFSRWII